MRLFRQVLVLLHSLPNDLLVSALVFNAMLLIVPVHAIAQTLPAGCGVLSATGRFGPYDYRPEGYVQENIYRSHKALLFIVENAHFTPEVESLIRGKTGAPPGNDIAYTLHAFPNHHRALLSVIALSEKERTPTPRGIPYPVECWFSRAIAFKPDDNIVRMIYASFLNRGNRNAEAEQQLSVVAGQADDNAFTYNNIGLIYFDMKNYEKALTYAHKAIGLGLGIPTLKDQLNSVGKWSEPPSASSGATTQKP